MAEYQALVHAQKVSPLLFLMVFNLCLSNTVACEQVFGACQACALNKSTIAILLLQASLLVATGGTQNSSATHDDM
jgi:hypothetical protein